MLIAHLSDPHLHPGREDKTVSLQRAVTHLLTLPQPPDAVLVTGDLADEGRPEAYDLFLELTSPLPMPVLVVPGNHDDRPAMHRAFGTQGTHALPDFMQYVVDLGPLRLVALDTHEPGWGGGHLDAARLAWLDARLSEAPQRPTLVFLHHPPLVTGVQVMDDIGLKGSDDLGAVLSRHVQVERLLAGHTHMTQTARFAGTLLMVCAGPDRTLLPDLTQPARLVTQVQPTLCLLHAWSERTGLVSYTSSVGAFPPVTLHDGERWL